MAPRPLAARIAADSEWLGAAPAAPSSRWCASIAANKMAGTSGQTAPRSSGAAAEEPAARTAAATHAAATCRVAPAVTAALVTAAASAAAQPLTSAIAASAGAEPIAPAHERDRSHHKLA